MKDRPAASDAWTPPVLMTTAVKAEGIEELVVALESHRARLESTGQLLQLRRTEIQEGQEMPWFGHDDACRFASWVLSGAAADQAGNAVGQALPNPDALAKITGAARFTDDYRFPGMLYARTLRAGIPHARIRSIDTAAARALPGVHAVLTHEDVPGRNLHGLVTIDWPVLCGDKVRYAGDAVALVAADSEEIAAAAMGLIRVDYEPLPTVDSAIEALRPGAAVLHEGRPDGNLLKHIKVDKGDIEAGFAEADVIVDRTYRTPTTEHLFLEPECAIGVPAGYDPAESGGARDPGAARGETALHDKTTVYVGSQIPYQDRE